ncbi:MAG TPA: sulfurtransferase TusA family protein [Terriglobales bacterium]|nr:sulfurtransferase TusA family protein [Terriglobales bacterium]
MNLAADAKIDCLGLFCPMPILKTREAMKGLHPGQVLEVTSDDPASEPDVRSWSAKTGHELLEVDRDGAVYRFLIRKTR